MATCSIASPLSIRQVSLETVRQLLGPHPAPCLSLYLPTHRRVPDNTVDLPAFRHLVEALEMAVSGTHPSDSDRLLHPFRLLQDDRHFWQHTRDGLAVLASDGRAQVFLLQRPVKPLALATSRFHTMPLLRIAASIDRFNLLALTSRAAHVYEGLATEAGVERLDPVPLHDLLGGGGESGGGTDVTRGEAIDQETFQPHRVQRGMGPSGMASHSIVHGGVGSRQDDIDADTEIFLRYVDEVVHERVTKHSGLPLVLVALPRLAAAFRRFSKNRLLLDEGVPHDVHLLPADELPALVAPLFATARASRIAHDVYTFMQARPHDKGSGDLSDIARAAIAGRVGTLLIERDRIEPGWLDPATGAIAGDGEVPADLSRSGDQPAMRTADLFGAVAEAVLLHGGGVVSLQRNEMPTESGVAAIYRY